MLEDVFQKSCQNEIVSLLCFNQGHHWDLMQLMNGIQPQIYIGDKILANLLKHALLIDQLLPPLTTRGHQYKPSTKAQYHLSFQKFGFIFGVISNDDIQMHEKRWRHGRITSILLSTISIEPQLFISSVCKLKTRASYFFSTFSQQTWEPLLSKQGSQ